MTINKYDKLIGGTLTSIASTPQEQLLFLNQFGAFYFWLHTLGASLLCLLFWVKGAAPNISIIAWFLAIIGLAVCCWVVKSQFRKHKLRQEQLTRYRLLNLILCTVWGMSGIFLFSSDPVVHAIHLCLLLVIALSVWPMSLVSSVEFYIQLALLLAPITLMLALQQDLKTNLLCFVILAFSGTAVLMAHFFSQVLNYLLAKEQVIIAQITVDPVTELVNSNYFDKTLKNEWSRCARSQEPLSLIVVEIDDFHKMESELDPKTAQKYLKTVTRCLKSVARRGSDTLAHYDDAEFAALLPGTKLDDAKQMAERLKRRIEKLALPNPLAEGQFLTLSVGIASCVPVTTSTNTNSDHGVLRAISYPAGLLEEAEQALGHDRAEVKAGASEKKVLETKAPEMKAPETAGLWHDNSAGYGVSG